MNGIPTEFQPLRPRVSGEMALPGMKGCGRFRAFGRFPLGSVAKCADRSRRAVSASPASKACWASELPLGFPGSPIAARWACLSPDRYPYRFGRTSPSGFQHVPLCPTDGRSPCRSNAVATLKPRRGTGTVHAHGADAKPNTSPRGLGGNTKSLLGRRALSLPSQPNGRGVVPATGQGE